MNDLNKYAIPDVPPHKQIELFTNFHKNAPLEHQYVTCPSTPEETLVKFKFEREGKAKIR